MQTLKIVRGACPHDCPDTCAMLYHVEDGNLLTSKVIRIIP